MQSAATDEHELSSVGQALLSAVTELISDAGKRVYAVMDGSQFNDLPSLLKQINVSHRPLYRHTGSDYSIILGGPWLINPYQAAVPKRGPEPFSDENDSEMSNEELAQRSAALSEQMVSSLNDGDPTGGGMLPVNESEPSLANARLRKLVQLSDGKPALVLWSGDEQLSAEQLYRHLRGLNRILVPKVWRDGSASGDGPRVGNEIELAAAGDGASAQSEASASDEMVIFRHSDANVMMQTIPALNEIQVARLFGPASSIIFAPDEVWGGGVKRARRGSDIEPPRGFLTLDRHAMAAMSASRLEVSRRRVMAYLREADPENNNLLDAELHKKVLFYEEHGKELGLCSERAHGQWAFLMSSSNGAIGDEQEVISALKLSGDADKTLDQIMVAMVKIGQGEISDWQIA